VKRDNGPVEILRKAGIGLPEHAASRSINHIATVKVRPYGLPDNHRPSTVCWSLVVNTTERLRQAMLRTKPTNLPLTWRKEVQPKRQLQPTRPHKPQYSTIQVSQEERTKLREDVPYVKIYRYNPKHLYPKLNGYGDNGQRIMKLWLLGHLLITKFILKLAGICGFCNANICT